MKKIGLGLVLGVAVTAGLWAGVREKAARDNAGDFLTKGEIPTYHTLSFHGKDDTTLGICKPCKDKAAEVLKNRVERAVDSLKGK